MDVSGAFGWKAQTATLEEFVLNAAAGEVGLELPGRHQAADPRLPGLASGGLDMSQEECNHLVSYVRSLPAPSASKPAGENEAAQIKAGDAAFKAIGCTNCHLPKLGQAEGIYSDLLLHDMGPQLADSDSYSVFAGGSPRGARAGLAARARRGADTASARAWRNAPLCAGAFETPARICMTAAPWGSLRRSHFTRVKQRPQRGATPSFHRGASNRSRRSSCHSRHLRWIDNNTAPKKLHGDSSKKAADRVHLTGGPPSSCNRRRSSQTASWSSGQIASPSSKSSSVATRTQQAIRCDISGGRRRHSKASRFPVCARCRQPPVVGAERQRIYGPTVLQRRTDW